MTYGNSDAPSMADLTKRKAKKKYGQGMAKKRSGKLSSQCAAGLHHMCIKDPRNCPCKCGHRGIW